MPIFKSPQVLDAVTGRPRPELVGQPVTVIAVHSDPPAPVEITEYGSGVVIPGSVLTVGPLYNLTPFVTPPGVYEVEVLAADGTRSYLETAEGARIAATAAQAAAEAAQASAQQAADAADQATSPTWNSLQGKPTTFPPTIGTGPDQAFPGDGNFDVRYYTKSEADARYAPFGSTGGGDATIEGIPSLIRVKTGGTYPPRGTARADLQIVWIGDTPPATATASSGADFVNEPIALNNGVGQGPDRFEAVSA